MSDESVEPVLKRKRISVACNSCRARKSKCDGLRPICGRCAGYDYECTWGDQTQSQGSRQSQLSPSAVTQDNPSEAFLKHQQLVLDLCSRLPRDAQEEVKQSLASIKTSLCCRPPMCKDACTSIPTESLLTIPRLENRKFVGEISDIHFLNLLTQFAVPDGEMNESHEYVDTYDPEEVATSYRLRDPLADMPQQDEVEQNLNTYFSTIHLAYPFVQKLTFMSKVESLQKKSSFTDLTPSWLSLLYALLAIGSFYNSFCQDGGPSNSSHRRLFERSFVLSGYDALERSSTQVSALLAQCFYMLATSQIDRCWASLGIAIRLSQSIGLHANTEIAKSNDSDTKGAPEQPEIRSRIWYCLYVLDRLMALQLGRPPAISDQDCHVPLPDRMEDLELDCEKGSVAHGQGERLNASEYFIHMIEFSSIIGKVLRETYHPRKEMAVMLQNTKHCDQLLLQWKQKLPRFLRFDIGHVFDKSVVLKRQRNMLAIKFHHLRTLIHRPYLCFPCLRGQNSESLLPDQYSEVQQYGVICILEAQAIAHLMHNVSDTMDIVMNYPWWQMISCLVCAASVIVMAECFDEQNSTTETRTATLNDDVGTCMEVLTALSNGSTGAKLALNMLKNIQTRGARISEKLCSRVGEDRGKPQLSQQNPTGMSPSIQDIFSGRNELASNLPTIIPANNICAEFPSYGEGDAGFGMGAGDAFMWSTVIPDSMNWPLEFLNLIEDPQHSSQSHSCT